MVGPVGRVGHRASTRVYTGWSNAESPTRPCPRRRDSGPGNIPEVRGQPACGHAARGPEPARARLQVPAAFPIRVVLSARACRRFCLCGSFSAGESLSRTWPAVLQPLPARGVVASGSADVEASERFC